MGRFQVQVKAGARGLKTLLKKGVTIAEKSGKKGVKIVAKSCKKGWHKVQNLKK